MKLFVFENVLWNYSSGIVVVTADSFDRACDLSYEKFKHSYRSLETLRHEFSKYVTDYVLQGEIPEGVKHHVYGGG